MSEGGDVRGDALFETLLDIGNQAGHPTGEEVVALLQVDPLVVFRKRQWITSIRGGGARHQAPKAESGNGRGCFRSFLGQDELLATQQRELNALEEGEECAAKQR